MSIIGVHYKQVRGAKLRIIENPAHSEILPDTLHISPQNDDLLDALIPHELLQAKEHDAVVQGPGRF